MTTASASGAPCITGTGSPRSEPRFEVLEIPRTKRRRPTLNAFSAIEVLVPYNSRLAFKNDVMSTPRAATGPTRAGSFTSGRPCRSTACMTVHQHTPSSSATPEAGRASSPTWRQAPTPARKVSSAREGR